MSNSNTTNPLKGDIANTVRRFIAFVNKLEACHVRGTIAEFWYIKGRSDCPTNDEFISEFMNSEEQSTPETTKQQKE